MQPLTCGKQGDWHTNVDITNDSRCCVVSAVEPWVVAHHVPHDTRICGEAHACRRSEGQKPLQIMRSGPRRGCDDLKFVGGNAFWGLTQGELRVRSVDTCVVLKRSRPR